LCLVLLMPLIRLCVRWECKERCHPLFPNLAVGRWQCEGCSILVQKIKCEPSLAVVTGEFQPSFQFFKAQSIPPPLSSWICLIASSLHWRWPGDWTRYYKLIAILRRQYHIILTASWEKIYSVLGGVAERRSPIRNIFSPNAVNIMWYCRLKIAISFVSRSTIYKDK